MAEFMLLIRNGEPNNASREQMQQIVQKYMAWAGKLRAEGRFKGGDEVQSNGRILHKSGGKIVDTPYKDSPGSVGGYFLIEAENYDHAVEITKECPGLEAGDSVEIRAISTYE